MQNEQPLVYQSVRAVGIVKPTFQPNGQKSIFADTLNVKGTAFWLKDYKVLVTCAHVVADLLRGPLEYTGLLMVGNLGQYSRATISIVDHEHDLAILKLNGVSQDQIEKESLSGLGIVDNYPVVGQSVAYAGFPLGDQLLDGIQSPTYAEGVVGVELRKNIITKEIQISGSVVGGFSGSPVVLKDSPGKIIGVLSRGPKESQNIFMAVSWEYVTAIAKAASI